MPPIIESVLNRGVSDPSTNTNIPQDQLDLATILSDSVDQNNQDLRIYDADTIYSGPQGFRSSLIDAPELPTNELKAQRLAEAKKSKTGRFVSRATAGERARLEAELLSVNPDETNPLTGLGGQVLSFPDTQEQPSIVDLGSQNQLGFDPFPELDVFGRIINPNRGAQEELVRRGFAVPFNQEDEAINEAFAEAQANQAGLFNPDTGDIAGIVETADRRSAPVSDEARIAADDQATLGQRAPGSTLTIEDFRNADSTDDSNAIDALQAGTAQLYGKIQQGVGELTKWGGEGLRDVSDSELPTVIGKKLAEVGEDLSKRGEYVQENANEYYGYDDRGSKDAAAVWGNLKEGKILDALDAVSTDGVLGLIGQSVPEMIAYFNPTTLALTYGGNVADAKREAEEVNGGQEISTGRMAGILFGEAVAMALERFAIDKAVGLPQINAKAGQIVQDLAGKVPSEILREGTRYAVSKAGNIAVASAAEGVQEVFQEGQRVLTTQLGERDILTEANLDRLGTAGVGGGLAGGGIRVGTEGVDVARRIPGAVETLSEIAPSREDIQNALTPSSDKQGTQQANTRLRDNDNIKPLNELTRVGELERAISAIGGEIALMEEGSKEYKTWLNRHERYKAKLAERTAELAPTLDTLSNEEFVNEFGSSANSLAVIADATSNEATVQAFGERMGLPAEEIQRQVAVVQARKSIQEVEQEVTVGDRGYLTYHSQLIAARNSGNTAGEKAASAKIIAFAEKQQSKSEILSDTIERVRVELNSGGYNIESIARQNRANSDSLVADWGSGKATVYFNDVAANETVGRETGALAILNAINGSVTAMNDIINLEGLEVIDTPDVSQTDTTVETPSQEAVEAPTTTETVQPEQSVAETTTEATEAPTGDFEPTVERVREIITNREAGTQPTVEEQQILANAADDGILQQVNEELARETATETAPETTETTAEPVQETDTVSEPEVTAEEAPVVTEETSETVTEQPEQLDEISTTLQSINAIEEEITKYHSRLSDIKTENRFLDKRIKTHRTEIKRLMDKKDRAKAQLEARREQLKGKRLRTVINRVRAIIRDIYKAIDKFNKLITDNYKAIDNYKTIKSQLDADQRRILRNIREFELIKSDLTETIKGTDTSTAIVNNGFETTLSNTLVKTNPRVKNSAIQEIDVRKIVNVGKPGSILGQVDLSKVEVNQHVRNFARKAYRGMRRAILPLQDRNENFRHKDSLGRGLLFDKDGGINTNTAVAIALSAEEYLSFNKNILSHNDIFSVGRMLGIQPEQVSPEQLAFFVDKGMTKKLVASTIGKDTLAKLGLRARKDVSEELYSKLEADLGQMGIFYLEQAGLIEPLNNPNLNVPIKDYRAIVNGTEESLGAIRDTASKVAFIKISTKGQKETGQLLQDIDIVTDSLGSERKVRRPRFNKNRVKVDYSVRRNDVTEVPQRSKDILNKLANEEYALDNSSYKVISEVGVGNVARLMGHVDEKGLGELAYLSRQAAEAKNREIEDALDSLLELNTEVERKGNGFYFDWFFSRNGRFFLDSNTVNPQTNKLHRFLVTPKSHNVEVDVSNPETFDPFRLAIAQAFGVGIDKVSNETAFRVADSVLKTSTKDLMAIFDSGELELSDGTHLEIEEVGHTIQAISAIRAYRRRDGGKFETNLTFELDAVTSGFIIKLMQFPLLSDTDSWLAKGGVFTEDYSGYADIEGTNAEIENGLVDSYRTLASEADGEFDLDESQDPFGLWQPLKGLLPTIIDSNGQVTGAGRQLFKYPFMTFNYGAKVTSIQNSLAFDMLADIPDKLLALGNDNPLKMRLAALGVDVTRDGIKEKDLLAQRIRGTDVTVGDAMSILLKETYGAQVRNVFERLFPSLTEANDSINSAFKVMFRLYDGVYQDRINNFRNTNNRLPSAEEKIEIIRSLTEIFPIIKAPFSDGNFDGVAVVDTKTSTQATVYGNAQTYRRDTGKSLSVQAIIKEFEESIAAGGVVPIHYLDGSMIGEVLDQGGIIGVHDAILPSLTQARKANEQYNDAMYTFNKNYSVMDEVNTSLGRVISNVNPEIVKGMKPIEIVRNIGGKNKKVKLGANQILRDINRLNDNVKASRENLFNKDMKIDHMTGMNAVIVKNSEVDIVRELRGKVNKKVFNDIMDVMKQFKDCKKGR